MSDMNPKTDSTIDRYIIDSVCQIFVQLNMCNMWPLFFWGVMAVGWQLVSNVLGQHISPGFNSQVVQVVLDCLSMPHNIPEE